MVSLFNAFKRTPTRPKADCPADFMAVERAERIYYLEYIRPSMTIFDVGANVGELTLLFSRFAEDGRVHAFEASSETYQKLETICSVAGRRNVTLNHVGLSDKEGAMTLNVYQEEYSAFNSQARRPLANYGIDLEPSHTESVRATTVDSYCRVNGIEMIDLLKIDVEGAELQVMRGARGMLKTGRVRSLTFEFGQTTFDMGNRPDEIESFLDEMGYEIKNVVADDSTFPGRGSVAEAKYSMHIATPFEKLARR